MRQTKLSGLVAVCVVAAACSSPPPVTVTETVTVGPTTTSPTTTSAKPSIMSEGYASVCTGAGYDDAPAYAGPGPHTIAVSVRSVKGPPDAVDAGLISDTVTLPAEWESPRNTALQLVACMTALDVVFVRECEYRAIGSTSGLSMFKNRLYNRVLKVEVRSTRTGKPVGGASEVTTETTTCAASVKQPTHATDVSPNQFGTLTDAQRDALLRDVVMATV
ncbi:hypothetical protein AB0I60_16000 [Actinosynnema sp. NPDC050436]|uniref:hypothetical protein n=1 Tax=Actinosynnema sp. NPDC050436 TaxID=3155659 RepID=UPI0033C6C517